MKQLSLAGCCLLAMWLPVGHMLLLGQEFTANYDESKVPIFTLPDPLICFDGTPVTDEATWYGHRRPEILRAFQEQMYGTAPASDIDMHFTTVEQGDALGSLATRKQVTLTLQRDGKKLDVSVLLYIPKQATGPVPAFLGLNFSGNHTLRPDINILLNRNWMRPGNEERVINNRATEESRGTAASRWAVEQILQRGYALVTVYYGDFDPDFDDGFANGVHGLFNRDDSPKPDEWGSIGAWAWGMSRVLDYLETDVAIDHNRVAVFGHSRLGKASLWAGALDTRFALVISNCSGCGGAALSRRRFGETVGRINSSFPHWFCGNFKQYNRNEDALPLDQHMVLALIAPRPLYVASAADDQWADPLGEFLSMKHADPVYRLLGIEGLTTDRQPAVNQPVTGHLSYHIRTGRHGVTDYDWEQYLNHADRFLMLR